MAEPWLLPLDDINSYAAGRDRKPDPAWEQTDRSVTWATYLFHKICPIHHAAAVINSGHDSCQIAVDMSAAAVVWFRKLANDPGVL